MNDHRRARTRGSVPVQRVERIMAIHRALKGGRPCTATDLARDLGVHVRTIYRDVEFLRDRLGAPVAAHGNRGYRYSDPTYALPDVSLTEGELLAFLVAERVVEGYAGSGAPFLSRVRAGLQKLSQGLVGRTTVSLDDLDRRRYPFDPGPLQGVAPELLQELSQEAEEVQIRFAPGRVPPTWHPAQRVDRQEDGSVILTLPVPPGAQLLRWILAQGRDARVLHPPALVEQVRQEIREMAALYG